MADGTYRRKQMVREIRIYIEGIGDESEDETKGKYNKTRHAPKLLELLDVDKVRRASRSCDRLFTTITKIIEMT